jgi:uncharacterized protein YcbX
MNTQTRSISEIWIYPIKSLGGIRLQKATLTERGLQWDRRWMLLDSKGQFMTQRQIASMDVSDTIKVQTNKEAPLAPAL